VKLPKGLYGDNYKAVGTPTADGVFLFFIPVADTYTANDFEIGDISGEACTITLNATSYEGAAAVKITNIVAADKDGNSTDLAGADVEKAVNHPLGDATSDFIVDLDDILKVIKDKVSGEYVAASDVNGDNVIDLDDILFVIKKKVE
jgi:hypothetical protein